MIDTKEPERPDYETIEASWPRPLSMWERGLLTRAIWLEEQLNALRKPLEGLERPSLEALEWHGPEWPAKFAAYILALEAENRRLREDGERMRAEIQRMRHEPAAPVSRALRRARRALRKAQRELDLRDGRQGDLWAVLDSQIASVELWMEEERK